MRILISKYPGVCSKCDAPFAVGDEIAYQKRVGTFCPACAPTDPEEIRAYLSERIERKAERLEGWAAARRDKANTVLNHNRRFTGDIAFNTQPGHIPFRARIIAQDDHAFASLHKAGEMEQRADRLRASCRVAGDAERKRQEKQSAAREWIKPGQRVTGSMFGDGIVLKVNERTATIGFDRGFVQREELQWLRLLDAGVAPLPVPPLCNFPGDNIREMTAAEWKRIHVNYRGEGFAPANAEHGAYRFRSLMERGCLVQVYLVDKKRVIPPSV